MLRSIGLISLIAFLSNCGGAQQVGPTAASGTVTQAQATTLKTQLDQLINNFSATTMQNPSNLVTIPGVTLNAVAQNNVTPYDACTTITPSNLVDNDGDGLVAKKVITYDCRGIVIPNHAPSNRIGTFILTDDDTVSLADAGAYSMEYDVEFSSDDGYFSQWNGEYSLTRPRGNVLFSSRFLTTFEEPDGTRGGYESNYTNLQIPNDVNAPYDAGSKELEGFHRLILKGDVTIDQQTVSVDWDFTFEISGEIEYELQQQSGCVSYYKSGYLQFHDFSRNVIRYDYTCTSVVYSYNGNQISIIGAP